MCINVSNVVYEGPFMIGVLRKRKKILDFLGLLFVNNIYTSNFKWEELNISRWNDSCGDDDFSHVYIIVH